MNKKKINLIGGGFTHCRSTNGFILPKKIEWVLDNSSNISIHVDHAIFSQVDRAKRNFAFLAESRTIIPSIYDNVLKHIKYLEENYELIFTHDKSFDGKSEKIKIINSACTSWILDEDRKIYPKHKLVSMIASKKNMCNEHFFRNHIADIVGSQVDLYGRGREKQLINKIDGLRDYCFSITMENGTYDNMYSEKILDCFTTGTIPVYYGAKCVENFFNPQGIIWLDKLEIKDLTFDLYHSKKQSIKENFEIASNLPLPEDYIYENFIKE